MVPGLLVIEVTNTAPSYHDLEVLQKEPNRSRYLSHPLQTPVVAAVQEVVDQRLQNPCRG